MATLILTAVGTAVGGPIGGAIGALLGQQVDSRLLAPKGRQGPRLGDLSVQTSSYGEAIPRIFGRMRVAGTVIWATDLKETRSTSSGGKGSPTTTSYSYSASFAVALSGRRVRAVQRIWADGNLLRGQAGDWKSGIGAFRLYEGGEGQEVDPLIAAIEAGEDTPAYRGTAYALFEDLQLADFGNRIPSLSFEIEADDEAVPVAAIVGELGGGEVAASGEATVDGYAVSGDSVRGAIEALMAIEPMSAHDDGAVLWLEASGGATRTIAAGDLGASGDDKRAVRRDETAQGAGKLPDEISIAYYEPDRDWQTGLQRARRRGGSTRVDARELPAAMPAGRAKAIAERELARVWTERRTMKVALPWRYLDLRPGSRVAIEGDPTLWRVSDFAVEEMRVELGLCAERIEPLVPVTASAGRATGAGDRLHGPTTLVPLDLPGRGIVAATAPTLAIAAAGASIGWRRATVSLSSDGGASWQVVGETAGSATIGTLMSIDAGASGALFDDGEIEIELLNDAMAPTGRDDDALIGGANLAAIGDELIQFGSVEPLGGRRYRLGRLLRGRGGTEWAIGGHAPGERFVLIEEGALLSVPVPVAAVGTELRLVATGVGDPAEGSDAAILFRGRSLRPPTPVHIRVEHRAGGDVAIEWIRRSRVGAVWGDADTPLGEEAERYRVTIAGPASSRIVETDIPSLVYSLADQAADAVETGDAIAVDVVQLGMIAASEPPLRYEFIL